MKLNSLKSRLVTYYKSSTALGGPALYVMSDPGRGKTTVLGSIAEQLNKAFPGKKFGIVIRNGASITLTTATGYLMPIVKDGVQYSEFTRPSWWTTDDGLPLEAYDGGVILIDEADKLGLDEKKLFGEAALSKVLGNHRLPPGWVVWFAGNYAKNRSGSTRELDHLILRQLRIHVSDDLESLLEFMQENNILPEVRLFAEENSQIVFMAAPDEQGPYCTPRTLCQAAIHLSHLMEASGKEHAPTDLLTQEDLAGMIGKPAVAQLMAALKLGQELPPYATIVAKPDTTPVPTKPDARRLACYKLASMVSDTDMAAVLTYVRRLPDEFQVMFGKAAVMRVPRFVINPHYAKWAQGKSQLIELMAKLK